MLTGAGVVATTSVTHKSVFAPIVGSLRRDEEEERKQMMRGRGGGGEKKREGGRVPDDNK